VIGLIAQAVVLACLAGIAGLGPAGWTVGAVYGLGTAALLARAMLRTGTEAFGPADWVTLTRATLVGGVAALAADALLGEPRTAVLVSTAVVALVLDGVDGQVARRTGTVSGFGARFDHEVDSFLAFVLGVFVASSTGWWVLAVGGMRYAFVAAGWLWRPLRGQLPYRFWRKVVAAVQGVALVAAASGLLSPSSTLLVLAAAVALLLESFGRDVYWLWRQHTSRRLPHSPVPAEASVGGTGRGR
jgi:phosphatidylglycerophosphate synthase